MLAIEPEPAGSDLARMCLAAYYAELARRFEEGFDADADKTFDPSELTPPKGWLVVARLDSAVVGCGALKILEPGIGEIKRVWTADAARGQGVARGMMDYLEALAVDAGVTLLRLDTNRALTEARGMYLRRGYVEIPPYNDNSYADHWFEKRL